MEMTIYTRTQAHIARKVNNGKYTGNVIDRGTDGQAPRDTNTRTETHTQRHTDTQTHRHTDRQTDTQTHTFTHTHTHTDTHILTHTHTDTLTHRHTHSSDSNHCLHSCLTMRARPARPARPNLARPGPVWHCATAKLPGSIS